MLKSINKQITVSAASVVTIETPTGNSEVAINYMSATIQPGGKIGNITQAPQNDPIYIQHIDEAKKDYDEFYNHLINVVKNNKE